MRPLLQHVLRSVFANAPIIAPSQTQSSIRNFVQSASNASSLCVQCQLRASSMSLPQREGTRLSAHSSIPRPNQRFFSTSKTTREEKKPSNVPEPSPETMPPLRLNEVPPTSQTPPPKSEEVKDNILRVPDEDLPSHREAQRWDFSKRLTELMDELLPKLAIVTQKVNTYTGTDYSGIEALRGEIKKQEQLVKARRRAIEEAKQALDAAHAQQASAQKEVVALLERKHSWSATDLERYMSLIRSEHVNDQAVREAKEAVFTAENALEESRTQLEKRERAQYHEEQIWSDTIRRNSTWVTFGLMGVNIFLLLASLIVIEPWRRRRMVREIKTALEAQKAAMEAPSIPAIEVEIDEVVEPTKAPESPTPAELATPQRLPIEAEETKLEALALQDLIPNEANPDTTPDSAVPGAAPLTPEQVNAPEEINIQEETGAASTAETRQTKAIAVLKDLVSEKTISIRRKDFTASVFGSAVAGAVISAVLILLIRPN